MKMKKLITAAILATAIGSNAMAATEEIVFGMGCFWGAEKRMSELPGVLDVESGYAGGDMDDATYYKVMAAARLSRFGIGKSHAEVVRVKYDTSVTSTDAVVKKFWESHDPTQGDRQGNDVGAQYRSAAYYTSDEQKDVINKTLAQYQSLLNNAGHGTITTEVAPLGKYFTAEEYHQNYLVKNPNGYCGLGGIGVKFPKGDE